MYYFIFYTILTTIILATTWRYISFEVRKTLLWFYIFYFASNMLGAIIFGLAGQISYGFLIDTIIDQYIQGEYVTGAYASVYWLLLFSPFLILPLVCLRSKYKLKIDLPALRFKSALPPFIFCVVILIAVMLAEIAFTHSWGILTLQNLSNSKEDYTDYIIGRGDVYASMSNRFFGYLYMTVPFFAHIAVYHGIIKTSHTLTWRILAAILIVFIALISIGINQKSPLILFLISILVGVSLIKKLSVKFFILVPVIVIGIVNFLQVFIQGSDGWSILLSVFHTLFRAPASLPFYVNYFPEHLPFVGIDFGILETLHIPATIATDNIQMHSIMWGQYFEKFGITGSVAAPFQYRAYAQAGLFFALSNVVLVGLFICFFGWLYKKKILGDAAVSHAFFAQSLIVLYYLSQTHIRDCIWSSYGIVWVIHGYLLYFILRKLTAKKIYTLN